MNKRKHFRVLKCHSSDWYLGHARYSIVLQLIFRCLLRSQVLHYIPIFSDKTLIYKHFFGLGKLEFDVLWWRITDVVRNWNAEYLIPSLRRWINYCLEHWNAVFPQNSHLTQIWLRELLFFVFLTVFGAFLVYAVCYYCTI